MARDWVKSECSIQYINTNLHHLMRVGSHAIIHHVQKYLFSERIWSQNVIFYCFLRNCIKFCRFCVMCNVLDLAPKIYAFWCRLQQNMEAYHVCIKYLARAIFKFVCFCNMYSPMLMNLCCFVWCFIVFLLFSLFFFIFWMRVHSLQLQHDVSIAIEYHFESIRSTSTDALKVLEDAINVDDTRQRYVGYILWR